MLCLLQRQPRVNLALLHDRWDLHGGPNLLQWTESNQITDEEFIYSFQASYSHSNSKTHKKGLKKGLVTVRIVINKIKPENYFKNSTQSKTQRKLSRVVHKSNSIGFFKFHIFQRKLHLLARFYLFLESSNKFTEAEKTNFSEAGSISLLIIFKK